DESHFSNEPYVQRGWFPIGYKKSLWTTEKREQDYLRSIKYENKKAILEAIG
ncbi:hypothetical protein MBAV_001043, partial [Candidatus Magnetobacterium bavaricum]